MTIAEVNLFFRYVGVRERSVLIICEIYCFCLFLQRFAINLSLSYIRKRVPSFKKIF